MKKKELVALVSELKELLDKLDVNGGVNGSFNTAVDFYRKIEVIIPHIREIAELPLNKEHPTAKEERNAAFAFLKANTGNPKGHNRNTEEKPTNLGDLYFAIPGNSRMACIGNFAEVFSDSYTTSLYRKSVYNYLLTQKVELNKEWATLKWLA